MSAKEKSRNNSIGAVLLTVIIFGMLIRPRIGG